MLNIYNLMSARPATACSFRIAISLLRFANYFDMAHNWFISLFRLCLFSGNFIVVLSRLCSLIVDKVYFGLDLLKARFIMRARCFIWNFLCWSLRKAQAWGVETALTLIDELEGSLRQAHTYLLLCSIWILRRFFCSTYASSTAILSRNDGTELLGRLEW